MAHQVESMFYVGETPWHGLGKQLDNAPTIEDAIKQAGLDWSVRTLPVFCEVDGNPQGVHPLFGNQVHSVRQALPAQALIRSTDNTVLGVVGARYRPLQNVDAFNWFQPFIDSGLVDLETAGSLQDGRKVWILARIKDGDKTIVGDDAIRSFIMLSNSHDGSLAIRAGFTPVRIVCANTLAMAHGNKNSQLLRIKHTASARITLDAVRDAMDLAARAFVGTVEQYQQLARTPIESANQLREYVKTVLGHIETPDDELSTRAANQIDGVIRLFEYGRGQQLPGVRGTAWAAYNAVTEYLTHEAGDDSDKRYTSLWFGQGANRNQLALTEALKLAA